jgi:methylase of polypeptide subunit release factors
MALTQGARRKIQTFVQSAKALLIREFASQLQQHYGIRPDGSYVMVEELTTHDAAIMQTARLLRERLNYLEGTIAGENKAEEAVEQLVREQAFTILNRFAALRMAEERKIIPEAIRNGYQSEGFQVFDQLTGGAKTAEVFERYTWFLKANFDELAIDLPAVFDRFSPYALLFPSERVLLDFLKIIDDEDLSIYREEGQQPMNLWSEDETIGWVYQYYNSRDEISAMREASSAPRNSRELAVRNQFFTPRYVVQFLVDNSLGRQWFEMTHGQTDLVDSCQYMVKREKEIFLAKGETVPEAKIEGANYIEYRALKDPRGILMLDPACGSMHFGLYCFDLYEQIYIETWDNHKELMPDLRDKYLREDFLKQIPRLILEYNIHGVDIDPRAIQIAGLSLWLRVQKSYNELGLLPADRPNITKSNLVVAEPMPGDVEILSDFTRSLPGPIGKLVRVIWEKMQLVGETGMLLKIEEELKKEIEIAKEEYKKYKNTSSQTTLFDSSADNKAAEMAAIYGKDQKITKDFFDTAEEEVLKALKNFAENAQGENAFQKLLFAEDTARGFAFIELCRKRYDVIVMNPPFGAPTLGSKKYISTNYKLELAEIFTAFVTRMCEIRSLNGSVGSISNRTSFFITTFKKWRVKLFTEQTFHSFADLGSGVLDAMVETCAYVITRNLGNKTVFIDLIKSENKESGLKNSIKNSEFKILDLFKFSKLPNYSVSHWISNEELDCFSKLKSFSKQTESNFATSGLTSGDDFRFFRLWWESDNEEFFNLVKGGAYAPYIGNSKLKVNWINNGLEIKSVKNSYVRSEQFYFQEGITWSRRTSSLFSARILPKNFIFADKGPAAFSENLKKTLCLFQSTVFRSLIDAQLAAGDQAARSYEVGIVNNTPVPDLLPDNYHFINELLSNLIELLSYDETSLFYCGDLMFRGSNLRCVREIEENIQMKNTKIVNSVNKAYNIDSKVSILNLSTFTDHLKNDKTNFENMLSYLFGSLFGRFDFLSSLEDKTNFFINDFEIRENNIKIEKSFLLIDQANPREFENAISHIFRSNEKSMDFSEELTQSIESFDFVKYFTNPNEFFNNHLKMYSDSGRNAPIYLPLSNKSHSFIVWLYYPAINDNTLFSIVNELLEPKLADVKKQVAVLEMTGNFKDLHEQMALLDELINFKDELLRVAQLPYKPNQDDGVLITAAPLHNLFTHSKWHKDTAACWKKLEKGEYDWAHLAYSIWPDRVTKKCKKDLSMAIAHGLESICEIKPKETKKKEKKGVKIDKQGKLI